MKVSATDPYTPDREQDIVWILDPRDWAFLQDEFSVTIEHSSHHIFCHFAVFFSPAMRILI
jgi:hypothetical protein